MAKQLSINRNNWFDYINIALMALICFIVLYPIWYSLVSSFNVGSDIVDNGFVFFWPRAFTFDNYKFVFDDMTIPQAFMISVSRTLIGVLVHVYFTAMVAYALTKKFLPGRKLYLGMATVTMFFGGGLIPTYLLMKNLGLIDNFWVYIFPMAFSFYDCLIFMGFFRSIPDSLEESAKIDGASDFLIFNKVILPLSTAVIATITIFHGVAQWNAFFDGALYMIKKEHLRPLQTYLYNLITTTEANTRIQQELGIDTQLTVTPDSMKIAVMMVTTAPIVIVYPFLQKHFTKGMMLGAVKG